MAKFWKALGQTAQKCKDWHAAYMASLKQLEEIAKKHGGILAEAYGARSTFGIIFAKSPDPKLWKTMQEPNIYAPRLSTKIGKAIQSEMDEIINKMPHPSDLSVAIGADTIGVRNGGICFLPPPLAVIKNDEVILATYKHYSPPKDVEIERISDVEGEAFFKV